MIINIANLLAQRADQSPRRLGVRTQETCLSYSDLYETLRPQDWLGGALIVGASLVAAIGRR